MNEINIPKQICWDILQCCILWYNGAEPPIGREPSNLIMGDKGDRVKQPNQPYNLISVNSASKVRRVPQKSNL